MCVMPAPSPSSRRGRRTTSAGRISPRTHVTCPNANPRKKEHKKTRKKTLCLRRCPTTQIKKAPHSSLFSLLSSLPPLPTPPHPPHPPHPPQQQTGSFPPQGEAVLGVRVRGAKPAGGAGGAPQRAGPQPGQAVHLAARQSHQLVGLGRHSGVLDWLHGVALQVAFERQILKPVFHLIGYRLWV
jgi:hypothetical protein